MKKSTGQCPCTALLKDGSRCGRYYKAGAPEPFCSVHRKDFKPTGAAVPRPKPISNEERLRRFAESNDPRVAMQAIGILERRAEGGSKQDANIARRVFLDALTDNERDQLQSILDQYKELQRVVYRRRLRDLDAKLATPVVTPDREALRRALELRSGQWRDILRGKHVEQGRLILQHLVDLPIRIMNDPRPTWMTQTRPNGMLVGMIQKVASPPGFEPGFQP
jgi:hypothetical protein